jgi:hypothetical protein
MTVSEHTKALQRIVDALSDVPKEDQVIDDFRIDADGNIDLDLLNGITIFCKAGEPVKYGAVEGEHGEWAYFDNYQKANEME